MNLEGLYFNYREVVNSLGLKETKHIILASIKNQRLNVLEDGRSLKEYVMSSSKRPPSCKENSLGTPWGLHEVAEKIGGGEKKGMVFESRKPLGLTFWECNEEKRKNNLITTRIMRLRGLEEGLNKGPEMDSYDRYIYIHGTNHEDRLGKPASSGCLQLSNKNMLDLFDEVDVNSHLWIDNTY